MPAPSVIRAERSLHPQRREPGWLETPCPERGSCRTVGDPRLRNWRLTLVITPLVVVPRGSPHRGEIPRGGANRRSVDRFIPRLWGTLDQPGHHRCRYQLIPTPVGNTPTPGRGLGLPSVHPHTRGEHMHWCSDIRQDYGSSPHPWGTHPAKGFGVNAQRFIPTPVGNTRRRGSGCCPRAVHPHTRGEHSTRSWGSSLMAGSSPHPWGTHHVARDVLLVERFIPTPVGNTGPCGAAIR